MQASSVKKRVLFDLLFWIIVKGYELLFYTTGSSYTYAINTCLSRLPGELLLYYTGIYYVLPAYFDKRNTRLFIGRLILSLTIAIFAYRIGRYYYFPSNRIDNNFWKTVFNIPGFFVAPFYFTPVPALGWMIYIFRRMHTNELQKKEAEKQRMIAEVNLLKSQIRPHFLFNTLNNLYGLALSSSSHTPGSIMRLSKIMEYMLYNSEKDHVTIGEEIQHIENYIELEKLRYGNRLQVSWDMDKKLYDKNISPLLLFPFIENAFKHGTGKDDENTWLSISLQQENGSFVYTVVNSIPSYETKPVAGGRGLLNLSKRLELSYPGRFELSGARGDSSYLSVLKININNLNL